MEEYEFSPSGAGSDGRTDPGRDTCIMLLHETWEISVERNINILVMYWEFLGGHCLESLVSFALFTIGLFFSPLGLCGNSWKHAWVSAMIMTNVLTISGFTLWRHTSWSLMCDRRPFFLVSGFSSSALNRENRDEERMLDGNVRELQWCRDLCIGCISARETHGQERISPLSKWEVYRGWRLSMAYHVCKYLHYNLGWIWVPRTSWEKDWTDNLCHRGHLGSDEEKCFWELKGEILVKWSWGFNGEQTWWRRINIDESRRLLNKYCLRQTEKYITATCLIDIKD